MVSVHSTLRFTASGASADKGRDHLLVGRHTDADISLPMPDVSRRHCRFIRTDMGWRVIDLASTNGTYVNGRRVEEADLQLGDLIRVGGVIFEVVEADVYRVA
jgi:pSer/pThr/pTyr-binding forkhead associated (FHA) protein